MDFLNSLLQIKIVEIIASAVIGWLITKLLDPSDKPQNQQLLVAKTRFS